MTIKLISASPSDWMPREAHGPTPPDHPRPAASQGQATQTHGSSMQRRDKRQRDCKHRRGGSGKHRVDRAPAGKASGSPTAPTVRVSKEELRREQAWEWWTTRATKEDKERLRRNRIFDDSSDDEGKDAVNASKHRAPRTSQVATNSTRTGKNDKTVHAFKTGSSGAGPLGKGLPPRAAAPGAKQPNSGRLQQTHHEGGETAPPATFTGTKRNGQIPTHRASAKHGTGAVHKAPHALHQALSGGKPTSATASMPTVPKPSASLLTETQQRANGATEKVLRAVTDNASQAAKLRAVRVCLSAAACHLEQAARTPPHATSRDRARRVASLQSAFHAVEGAAQAVHVPLQEGFLQQGYSLLITKLRIACQTRLCLAERIMVRSTGQEPTAEQEQEWKQRRLYAASLRSELSDREGALHRAALDSKLGSQDARQGIRELVVELQPSIPTSMSTNCM
ncbi:hypothetical protein ABBQ38_010391 [Trebouxia sp. C0009 RCD-2024]